MSDLPDIEFHDEPDPRVKLMISGEASVHLIPAAGELLAMDGKQAWVATEGGVTTAVAVDLTPFIKPGSVRFA